MTEMHTDAAGAMRDALASTSRDLGLELLGLRLNGAQLGTMLGVSRQAVSAAVKRGTIAAPGPDGLFDARRAVREWMANADPARVRARAMKPGAEMVAELRDRVNAQAAELAQLRDELAIEREWGDEREAAAKFRAEGGASQSLARFVAALVARFADANAAQSAGRLPRWLDEVAAVEFYGHCLDAYRADFPEDQADGEDDPAA
jgi:hypothetical protein